MVTGMMAFFVLSEFLQRWDLEGAPFVAVVMAFAIYMLRSIDPDAALAPPRRRDWWIALRWWVVIVPATILIALPISGIIQWIILLPLVGIIVKAFQFMIRDLEREIGPSSIIKHEEG